MSLLPTTLNALRDICARASFQAVAPVLRTAFTYSSISKSATNAAHRRYSSCTQAKTSFGPRTYFAQPVVRRLYHHIPLSTPPSLPNRQPWLELEKDICEANGIDVTQPQSLDSDLIKAIKANAHNTELQKAIREVLDTKTWKDQLHDNIQAGWDDQFAELISKNLKDDVSAEDYQQMAETFKNMTDGSMDTIVAVVFFAIAVGIVGLYLWALKCQEHESNMRNLRWQHEDAMRAKNEEIRLKDTKLGLRKI